MPVAEFNWLKCCEWAGTQIGILQGRVIAKRNSMDPNMLIEANEVEEDGRGGLDANEMAEFAFGLRLMKASEEEGDIAATAEEEEEDAANKRDGGASAYENTSMEVDTPIEEADPASQKKVTRERAGSNIPTREECLRRKVEDPLRCGEWLRKENSRECRSMILANFGNEIIAKMMA